MRSRNKENDMMDVSFISRYERRVSFVEEVIAKNSTLGDDIARELAVQVVHAIDHIPEPTR
jgi:phage tail protein X